MEKQKLSLVGDVIAFLTGRNGPDDTAEALLKRHRKYTTSDWTALNQFSRNYKNMLNTLLRIERGNIPATRNQLANSTNRWQTDTKKVLTVCSAGLLRSPTAANVLHKEFGYNTRAAGSCLTFALIPLSEALISWADEIVFVQNSNYWEAMEDFDENMHGKVITVLDVPDQHSWNDPELRLAIMESYVNSKPFRHEKKVKNEN